MTDPATILLVGPLPPPLGGVSVHVQRLRALLVQTFHVGALDPFGLVYSGHSRDAAVRGRRALWDAGKDLRAGHYRLAHMHVSTLRKGAVGIRIALALAGPKTRTVLTLHDQALVAEYARSSGRRQAVLAGLMRRFDHVLAVNEALAEFAESLGAAARRVSIVPAFLPDTPRAHPEASCIVERFARERRVAVVSGYGLPRWGMHALLDAFDADPGLADGLAPLFCLYGESDPAYVRAVEARVARLPAGAVLRDLEAAEFIDVLGGCHLFVRPTTADGDSVAVREAAAAGLQLVASDAIERPEGALLYSMGCAEELAGALRQALEDPAAGRVEAAPYFGTRITDVYEELLASVR